MEPCDLGVHVGPLPMINDKASKSNFFVNNLNWNLTVFFSFSDFINLEFFYVVVAVDNSCHLILFLMVKKNLLLS